MMLPVANRRPLEGIRVLALEQHGAGPFATLQLADLGAQIIKIEDPRTGGDIGRRIPPFVKGNDSLFFQSLNRNKQSVALDLRLAEGREVFQALAARADVFLANVRGDVLDRFHVRYEQLRSVNPRLVCCFLTGYGLTGPSAHEPAYDPIIQALAGWMSQTGEPGGPPTKSGLSLVDFCGGYVAALSTIGALLAALRDGRGTECDISLFDTAISLLTYLGAWQLTEGYEPPRRGRSAHPSLVPFQLFRARDGWLVVGIVKQDQWERFTEALDRPDLRADPRFQSAEGRLQWREVLQQEIDTTLAERSIEEWLKSFPAYALPCAPVNSIAQALQDAQVLARKLILSCPHPVFGTLTLLGSPLKIGHLEQEASPAPALGQDTAAIVRSLLGYSDEEMAQLDATDVFGPYLRQGGSNGSSF